MLCVRPKTIFAGFLLSFLLIFFSCKKEKRAPLITTSAISCEYTTASCAVILYSQGDASVSEKGICWGTNANITIADNKIACGSGEGNFSAEMTGLEPDHTYYVRGYATNSHGTSYGEVVKFRTKKLMVPETMVRQPHVISVNLAKVIVNVGAATDSAKSYTVGLCWGTSSLPTIKNTTMALSDLPHQEVTIEGLGGNVTYYVRAFASNEHGTAYSREICFVTPPGIKIVSVSGISLNSASCQLQVMDPDPAGISSLGLCWSTLPFPTTADNKTSQSFSSLIFTGNVSGLSSNTMYYVRAYIVNSAGTFYSEQKKVKTYKGTVTDIDGNTYYTVEIGGQEWMASNLRVTRYNDGTAIKYIDNKSYWNYYVSKESIYAYYGDNPANDAVYGKLYPWTTVMTTGKQIAPAGWRIPTLEDWNTLLSVGNSLDLMIYDGSWLEFPDCTNSQGFSAQPGGYIDPNEASREMGYRGWFWTSTSHDIPNAKICFFYSRASTSYQSKQSGLSVRCIKN